MLLLVRQSTPNPDLFLEGRGSPNASNDRMHTPEVVIYVMIGRDKSVPWFSLGRERSYPTTECFRTVSHSSPCEAVAFDEACFQPRKK